MLVVIQICLGDLSVVVRQTRTATKEEGSLVLLCLEHACSEDTPILASVTHQHTPAHRLPPLWGRQSREARKIQKSTKDNVDTS